MKTKITGVCLSLAILLISSGHAQALSVTYSDSFGGALNSPTEATAWTHSLHVQQFDPTLGTLQSISFSAMAQANGYVFAMEMLGKNGSFNSTLGADIFVKMPPPPAGADIILSVSPITSISSAIGPNQTLPSVWGTVATDSASTNLDASTLAPAQLAYFIGSGFVDIPTFANKYYQFSDIGTTILNSGTAYANVFFDITYNYDNTPVPEPCTLFTLGAGISGIALFRRRFRSSSATKTC